MTDQYGGDTERLFQLALSLSPQDRKAFLEAECADAELRAKVEALLDYDAKAAELEAATTVPPEAPGRSDRAHAADRAEFAPATVISGHYHVERLLGRGGMGSVYLARDSRLERPVALKFLGGELARDADQRRRFLAEARAASALNHPNVCVIYEVGETEDGHPFLAMECIEGRGLDALVREGTTSVRELLPVATQLVAALDAAHSRGIVHRDIKPQNVCITTEGRVKVLDFGLAKRLDTDSTLHVENASGHVQTLPGVILGTPAYMSPEQALGGTVDSRSDLFSVGVVLYELAAGALPFQGASLPEVLKKVISSEPAALSSSAPGVPEGLERIVERCLRKDPAERYQNARELLADLRRLRKELFQDSADTEEVLAAEVTALDPAEVDVEILAPRTEEVRESDVFISYATVDDLPVHSGRDGWISQLHKNLELRMAQLSGEAVRVWRQPDPGGRAEIEKKVLELVPDVKTLVSVVSPPFVKSEGCRKIVKTFWESTNESGRFRIDDRARIFNVVKTPVEGHELPNELAPLFAELASYEFFERDPESGRLREFDEAFGEMSRQRFYERVYDLAYEVCQVLRHLASGEEARTPATRDGKTIFLATTTSDLEAERDQIRRALVELGHDVLPKQQLPFVARDLSAVVRGCLETCDLAVHLIGDRYGLVPEDTELSVVAFQNQIAAELSDSRGLQRLIWMPTGLEPRDDRQAEFVRELPRSAELHRGAEVIVDSLENLKEIIEVRTRPEIAAPLEAKSAGTESPPRVYLICDAQDEEAVEVIEDALYAAGLEVSLPAFDVEESEAQDIHIRNLTDCDAVLIYYGSAGKHWVDFKVRDLQKAAGYRSARPIEVAAVYLAPPFDRRKERFKSLSVDIIRAADDFSPQEVSPFVEKAKAVAARGGE